MAPVLAYRKGIGFHKRQTIECNWDVPEASALDDVVCNVWAIHSVCDFGQMKTRVTRPDFSLWTQKMINRLALGLSKEISARSNILAPVLNLTLQSALATLHKANDLTASELIALNDAIGGASIQNEFDIETFYAKEDEVSG